MPRKKLSKLRAQRTRFVKKHADYSRRVDMLPSGGRLPHFEAKLKQLKRWKCWCKTIAAQLDNEISEREAKLGKPKLARHNLEHDSSLQPDVAARLVVTG